MTPRKGVPFCGSLDRLTISNRKNPWNYDKRLYKQRNQAERLSRRLKSFTRYDKLDVIFLAFVHFALIVDPLM